MSQQEKDELENEPTAPAEPTEGGGTDEGGDGGDDPVDDGCGK
jgi:hypothetical protein